MKPFLRRNIFEPLAAYWSKSPKLRYWKQLEESQYRTTEELKTKQWDRLRHLLQFAYERNMFYRRRFESVGILPGDIRCVTDLKVLPVLSKREVRNAGLSILSNGYTVEQLLTFKTGGSTGKALKLYLTEECSELRNACARRHDRWTGWEPGEPVGALWGNVSAPKGVKQFLRRHMLEPVITLDTMSMDRDTVREFARQWRHVRPTLLFGHAHSIYLLSRYVEKLSLEEIRPRGIISTSMMLLPHERYQIEKVFGKIVFDRYGCEEVGLIASECEIHDGMHMNIEHLVIEFEDCSDSGSETDFEPRPADIVVTDLVNLAMPLIRYRIEDIGFSRDRSCRCGRGLPLMDKVVGRVADFLVRVDGSRVAGVSLIENTLTKLPGLEQMQVIQDEIAKFRIRLVTCDGYQRDIGEALISYFQSIFGRVDVALEFVHEIPREPNGKYRFSICNVGHVLKLM